MPSLHPLAEGSKTLAAKAEGAESLAALAEGTQTLVSMTELIDVAAGGCWPSLGGGTYPSAACWPSSPFVIEGVHLGGASERTLNLTALAEA